VSFVVSREFGVVEGVAIEQKERDEAGLDQTIFEPVVSREEYEHGHLLCKKRISDGLHLTYARKGARQTLSTKENSRICLDKFEG